MRAKVQTGQRGLLIEAQKGYCTVQVQSQLEV